MTYAHFIEFEYAGGNSEYWLHFIVIIPKHDLVDSGVSLLYEKISPTWGEEFSTFQRVTSTSVPATCRIKTKVLRYKTFEEAQTALNTLINDVKSKYQLLLEELNRTQKGLTAIRIANLNLLGGLSSDISGDEIETVH